MESLTKLRHLMRIDLRDFAGQALTTLIVAVLGLVIVLAVQCGGSPAPAGDLVAMQYCEHAVKQRLRSPGSADFQYGHASKVISLGNDKYTLRSFVDSGADQIRTYFVCDVQGGDSFNDFRVVNLEILR